MDDIVIGDITLKHVSLNVFIRKATNNGGTTVKFAIEGTVEVGGLSISAGLYLNKVPSRPLQWVVYGELAGNLTMSRLVPNIRDTFLDLSDAGGFHCQQYRFFAKLFRQYVHLFYQEKQ